jgi:opacity protein-like surface antigen
MKLAKNFCLAAVLSLGCAAAAMAADCASPKKPANPPSGKTATQEEMIAAMKASKQFDADVKAYQACLNTETEAMIAALGDKATPDDIERVKSKQDKKANEAYEDATKVADAFNVQLRAFKAK